VSLDRSEARDLANEIVSNLDTTRVGNTDAILTTPDELRSSIAEGIWHARLVSEGDLQDQMDASYQKGYEDAQKDGAR
jgi:hypothetical protein